MLHKKKCGEKIKKYFYLVEEQNKREENQKMPYIGAEEEPLKSKK